jgi:hypothetical protein
MGWFEVINTGLNIAGTAANISVAKNINKMQQDNERAAQEAAQRGEMLDLIDRVNRRVRRLGSYLEKNPKATIVLCEFYDKNLKAMGVVPSKLNPEDRHVLRDLNEKFEDFIEHAKSGLPEQEVLEAYGCLDAIDDLPLLEAAISAREDADKNIAAANEAEKYLQATEGEWNKMNIPAGKAKKLRTIGILILLASVFATCTVVPTFGMLVVSGFSQLKTSYMQGSSAVGGGLIGLLVWAGFLVLGFVFFNKGKIPNNTQYQELSKSRANALSAVQKRNAIANIDPRYAGCSLPELHDIYKQKDVVISAVLGKMADFNKLALLPD